jgi:hypothetical protein
MSRPLGSVKLKDQASNFVESVSASGFKLRVKQPTIAAA